MKSKNGLSFWKSMGRWVVKTRTGCTLWSRVVYQNYVLNGQEIPKGTIIHHKNQDPVDDRPENLEATVREIHAPIHHEGTKHSEETKRKIGQGNSGKERSLELRQRLSEVHLGKPLSAEHSKRISEGLSGKPKSPEHAEKVRQANLGKKRSPETKARISEAKKLYFQNKRNSE